MAHPRSHARFTVGGRVRLSGRYLATGRMATMNKSTAALLMAGALLAGCSSGADSAGSAAASVSTCEVVQQQWSAYFEAARQLTSAGTGATERQKSDFRAVRIGVLAELNRIAAAGSDDVNTGAGLIATSLATADQAAARETMVSGTLAVKRGCGISLGN
jgi:hypothetical protein